MNEPSPRKRPNWRSYLVAGTLAAGLGGCFFCGAVAYWVDRTNQTETMGSAVRDTRLQIRSWLQAAGPDAAFSLVAIPESVRGEILRKTDTKTFPMLLETCRITVVGQMTTGMPVASSSFGPVDRRQEPARWMSESEALMALLSEPLTTGRPALTVEHFRSIRFEDS